MKLMKPCMENKYWRLNPPMENEIRLDMADDETKRAMEECVNAYLELQSTKNEI